MTMTLRQIAEKVGVSIRYIQMRCRREAWPSCGTIMVNHNPAKIYRVSDLPEDIRERISPSPQSSPARGEEDKRQTCPAPVSLPLQARGFFEHPSPSPGPSHQGRGNIVGEHQPSSVGHPRLESSSLTGQAPAGPDPSAGLVIQVPGAAHLPGPSFNTTTSTTKTSPIKSFGDRFRHEEDPPSPQSSPARGEDINSEADIEMEIFAAAPEWARRRAEKWIAILDGCAGMKGAELETFVSTWNAEHPEMKTSYPRVIEMRRRREEQGVTGLLPKYGKSVGITTVSDEWFQYFHGAYLKEGAPSLKSCWVKTLGYAREVSAGAKDRIDARTGEVLSPSPSPQGGEGVQTTPHLTSPSEGRGKIRGGIGGIDPKTFPSPAAFLRRLEREVPEDAVFLARHGRKAWNRKYASYIDRDYSALAPGECIVSDHAQVDVAVLLEGGKVVFPWVTAWRCFKTGKWTGWMHHAEAPKSDHIFQSFYYAVKEYGVPTDVYIDNGKDYRCRDFAGGRRYHRVDVDETKTTAMLSLLGVTPRFALPYNAQTKTIERDFLRNKEWFSKHMPGYRGGNVTERPEKLADEIKRGRILHWEDYQVLMNRYITDVANKLPSHGKVLQGRSPDEAWQAERRELRKVGADALKLFCMRTTRPLTIGRNGVLDSEIGMRYWAEWMVPRKGEQVYLRRDVNAWQEAWCFRADTDEYIGKAQIAETAAALARTDIEKAQLGKLIARKRQAEKIARAYIDTRDLPTPSETVAHMAAGVAAVNEMRGKMFDKEGKEVKVIRMANTRMDKVIASEREMQKTGTYDLSAIVPEERTAGKVIHLYQCDKEEYERRQKEGPVDHSGRDADTGGD